MSELVSFEVTDGIATLTMDDGKANAFGPGMISALTSCLSRASAEAQAVIVTGRPGVLCAGFDLKIIRGEDETAKRNMRESGVEAMLALYLHPQPVLFACTGHAVAAGALLLLTGDYRIGALGDFKIGLNEVAIGLPLPEFALQLAYDRLDKRAIDQAVLNATLYDPEDAAQMGYLDRTASAEDLIPAAREKAAAMMELDANAFAATKMRMRQGTAERIRQSMA